MNTTEQEHKVENNTAENNDVEPVSPPVCVLTSTIPARKMAAIENLSVAIVECAKALNSTNVEATISNCHFACGEGPAINIQG